MQDRNLVTSTTLHVIAWFVLLTFPAATARAASRPRIRDLGVRPGILEPGPLNAITDVKGVRVGHRTLIRSDRVRTGVTAVLPHGGNLFQDKVPAAVHVGNAFGKAAGFLQVQELGQIETPIILTNTLAVGTAIRAVVEWTLQQPENAQVESVNAVVGETNDGDFNDIRGFHVQPQDIWAAIESASSGPVEEGNVGAGTGTWALGWKAGIGSSSRSLPARLGGLTVGALVQSNFGGTLRVDGVRVGERLGTYAFQEELSTATEEGVGSAGEAKPDTGSVMIVLATDAPLDARNLERLARRAMLALGRVGSFMSNGSGDFVIAFSTANTLADSSEDALYSAALLRNDRMSPLFLATVEAVEEAIYNSLLRAESMTGYRGFSRPALPIAELTRILAPVIRSPSN